MELGSNSTASGTSVSFSSIPDWVNELVLLVSGVSQSSTGHNRIRLVTAFGTVATGYVGTRQYINMASATTGASLTDGFYASSGGASVLLSGQITLKRYGTAWFISGVLADTGGSVGSVNLAGSVVLSDVLTGLEWAATAGGLDAGSVSLIGRA